MTVGGREPSEVERLLDQLDGVEEMPPQGSAAALQQLLGQKPDEPKRPKSMESVRGGLEMLLGDMPAELGKAALEALDAEYAAGAATKPQWAAGPGLMQALGAAEPLSTLEVERQIDAAAQAEIVAARQLEQEQQNRAMLVALLQGLVDGEAETDRLLDESDPAGPKRRRKRDRRRARAAELLRQCEEEDLPDDLSPDELTDAVAWLYEGEARPDQHVALEQLMGGSAADKLLSRIDDSFADDIHLQDAPELGDAGAVGRLMVAEESSLEEGITQEMVHHILTQDSAQDFGRDQVQAEGGWRRVVGDSDALWSDGQPPAHIPSAYADSLQVLGVLPLPGDSRTSHQFASDAIGFDVTAAGDGDALDLLGIAESDQPEPKLPRGARNLNDLLGRESDLLKLLAEPFDVRHPCSAHFLTQFHCRNG
jgi:hypothetical protein